MSFRICAEVPWRTHENPHLADALGLFPDIPGYAETEGLVVATHMADTNEEFCRVVVSCKESIDIPSALWTGSDKEAIQRWGVDPQHRLPTDQDKIVYARFPKCGTDINGVCPENP